MKLHVISDLHNEFSLHQPSPASYEADVIVLPGDIWKYARGIGWARETWPNHRIVYVAGNHEYYGKMRKPTLSKLHIANQERYHERINTPWAYFFHGPSATFIGNESDMTRNDSFWHYNPNSKIS